MTSSAPVRVVWSREMLAYDFGHGHPMTSERLDLTIRLAEDARACSTAPTSSWSAPRSPSDDLLQTVHDARVRRRRARRVRPTAPPTSTHGLGTSDDPVFPDMHEATARVVQGSVDSALAVWEGRAVHAVNVTGGLHHAMPASRRGSASTTTRPSPSARCWTPVPSGSPTSTSTRTTATASRRSSGTTRACSRSPCTRPGRRCSRAPATPRETGGPGAEGTAVNVALPVGHGRRRLAARARRRRARRGARVRPRTCWSRSTAATRTCWTR